MEEPYRATGDVYVLPSSQAAPGYGILPVNAFVIRDKAPVLLDTGLGSDRDAFLGSLWGLVEPDDLRWIFLTHEDRDHAGNLLAVLEAAPRARLVTNYVTVGKLLEAWSLPLDRVVVVNPGQRFSTSEREIVVVRPPAYDASGTVGLWDPTTRALFTVDAFGAYLPELVQDLGDLPEEAVRAGLITFNRANHPWTALADGAKFRDALQALRRAEPQLVLSSHSVPAPGRTDSLFEAMATLPDLEPFVAPDQSRFEELRGEMG
jgi:glyoxylase-like metal-dependent hydrolase (beta-lactamase superfamily II)